MANTSDSGSEDWGVRVPQVQLNGIMVCGGSIPSIPTTASYQRHGCGVFRKIASSKATTGTNERNSQRNEGAVASRDLKH